MNIEQLLKEAYMCGVNEAQIAEQMKGFKHDFKGMSESYANSKVEELIIPRVSNSFKAGTYSLYKEGSNSYCHWSEGLKMVIEKDGVTIKLEGDEIKKLAGSLPRTIGGVY